jgi:tetratricopeptide (TPR) repeat protein
VTRKHEEEGLTWFDRAIEIDPEYGRAHAWRACALATLMEWTGEQETWRECMDSAEKAFDLDPNEGEVHRILGSINLINRKFDKAEYHFNRGLELNPNNAYIAAKTAALYSYTGRPEKALKLLALADRLDPTLPDYCREEAVVANYVLKRHANVVAAAAAMNRLTRRAAVYAAAASADGEKTNREAAVRELMRIDPDFSIKEFVAGEPYKDNAQREALKSDLAALGLPA